MQIKLYIENNTKTTTLYYKRILINYAHKENIKKHN